MSELAVAIEPANPRAAYALEQLLSLLGLRARAAAPGETPDLVYGEGPGRCRLVAGPREGWDDPRPSLTRDDGLAIVHRPHGPAERRIREGAGPGFDVLYAAYACLTGVWERADPVDEAGCPLGADGWLARNGVLSDPLVHRYAAAFYEALAPIGVQPQPLTPTLVLTHDVDNSFRRLFGTKERLTLIRRDLRARNPAALRRIAGLTRWLARGSRAVPGDEFGAPDGLGGARTFFVASFGLFDRGSAPEDVPYSVSHPDVRDALRRVAAGGADIGVHFSLQAARSEEQTRREVERLEWVVGAPVRAARHHWWALGTDPARTLGLHARAGIVVDCSFGFNDACGFRRGIAAPFRLFDPDREAPHTVWSLPTMAMDLAAFPRGRPLEDGLAELDELARTVREVGGALVLDWHEHTLAGGAANARTGLVRFVESVEGFAQATPLALAERASERTGGRSRD